MKRNVSATLAAVVALCGLGAAGACATKLGDPNTAAPEGRPCAHENDCPQPVDPCQVWTCWQGVCTPVASAKDTVLPKEAQTKGDCKVLVCDGQGKTAGLVDKSDEPPEDDNPCALEVCQDGEPAYPPLAVGAACGKNGVCNGHGKCGGCLPEAQRCQGNKPEVCSEEGAWESEGPCAAATPICADKTCIGVPEIAAGDGFSCVRIADGKVRCFGDPADGKLGQQGARRVNGLSGVVQVASGGEHTCALLSSRTVQCWGSNSVDQLGDATVGQRGSPAPIPKLANVTQIAAGDQFSCARIEDGTAVCWGSDEYGQLGTGPAPPSRPSAAATPKMMAAVLTQDRPTEVVGLSGAVALSLGLDHACARLADGGVSCWGSDAFGALGRGVNSPPSKAKKTAKSLVAVKGLRDVVEVAAGNEHACARLQDGTVTCWGRNQHGQLGDGTTKAQTKPVKVKGLAGAAGLALGAAHSCARLQDGTVQCWGWGASGQLGDATKADHTEPFAVPGLSAVVELAGGSEHLCAKLENRTFVCWGGNPHGELGSGASGEKPSAILW
jgi:alpha-tubulin suppressor-like RCC1 family protein